MIDEIIKYLEKEKKKYLLEARDHFRTYRLTEKRYSCFLNYGKEKKEKANQIQKYIDYLKQIK